jgi:oxygen-independent coproporphyrinogen-3 oxidase
MGLGPSAHSFDGKSRQWNIANNSLYIKHLSEKGSGYFEKETLTEKERFNEYMLISLRTMWGTELAYLKSNFNDELVKNFLQQVERFIQDGTIILKGNFYTLTEKGKLLADRIAGDLFA